MSDQNNEINFEPFEPEEDYQGEPIESSAPAAASGNNRNFLIAAGIIGGVFLIGLIVMGVLAASFLPQRQAAMRAQQELVLQQNTATAEVATQEAAALALAQMPSPTLPPTATLAPTNTPVVVVDTPTPEPPPAENKAELPAPAVQTEMAATQAAGGQVATLAPGAARTATLAVLLTQVAAGNQTAQPAAGGGTAATSTALPSTGFADEVGLPGLFAAALGLMVLILLARSLRLTTR